jgi:hypothetical protein
MSAGTPAPPGAHLLQPVPDDADQMAQEVQALCPGARRASVGRFVLDFQRACQQSDTAVPPYLLSRRDAPADTFGTLQAHLASLPAKTLGPTRAVTTVDELLAQQQPPAPARGLGNLMPTTTPFYDPQLTDLSLLSPQQRALVENFQRRGEVIAELMPQFTQYLARTTQAQHRRPGQAPPTAPPKPLEIECLTPDDMALLSQQAGTFPPCANANECVGFRFGLGSALMAYMPLNEFRACARSGKTTKRASGFCVRCMIESLNGLAFANAKEGRIDRTDALPFYVPVGTPGAYRAEATRSIRMHDAVIRPMLCAQLNRLCQTERTFMYGQRRITATCLADMPDLLVGDHLDVPRTDMVRPDTVRWRAPTDVLTLDKLVRYRLADRRLWAGSLQAQLPVQLAMPHQALDCSLAWLVELQPDALAFELFLYTLPLEQGLVLMRWLLGGAPERLAGLRLQRHEWPEGSKLAALLREDLAPAFVDHMMFYLVCGRYHFAQRCSTLLQCKLMLPHQTRLQPMSTKPLPADEPERLPTALIEQLEQWCNALLPLLCWYNRRAALQRAYTDRVLLTVTPKKEGLAAGACLEPSVGTAQPTYTDQNTHYEIVEPYVEHYMRPGDEQYANCIDAELQLPASHELLAANAAELAAAAHLPVGEGRAPQVEMMTI